ncbi:MAG: efflux RND transporter periplasmic adaptor subunit [Aestuariibacter sp.]
MRYFCLFILLALSTYSVTPIAQEDEHNTHTNPVLEQQAASRYVCPMHSHIVRDHPGTCPICGMDLIQRNKPSQTNTVEVSGALQQAMAVTTEKATRGTLWRFVKTFGAVQLDETRMRHIHPRTNGWIEKLQVNMLGQRVNKGDLLYEIYSPELLVAQEDFLALLRSSAANDNLLSRGKTRLALLGMDQSLIAQLIETRQVIYTVPYYAQESAVVTALHSREGMYVKPENEIMTLANLSSVWIVADVLEQQIDWVTTGKWVEMDIPGLGLFAQEAQIEFIYPTLDSQTRTLKVRFSLKNPDERLKPNMLATVRIYGGPLQEVINIPVQALIQTGKQNRVIVRTQNHQFEQREVTVGAVTQGRAEIISGINVGDDIVTSGQFLIDAEASLSNMSMAGDASHQHH